MPNMKTNKAQPLSSRTSSLSNLSAKAVSQKATAQTQALDGKDDDLLQDDSLNEKNNHKTSSLNKHFLIMLTLWEIFLLGSLILGIKAPLPLNYLLILGLGSSTLGTYSLERCELNRTWYYVFGVCGLIFTGLALVLPFCLDEVIISTWRLGILMLGLIGTAMLFSSLSKPGVNEIALKYLLSWVIAVVLAVGINFGNVIGNLQDFRVDNLPQLLQVIANEKALSTQAVMPEPEISGQALKGVLQSKQMVVYVIPYSFYRDVKVTGNLASIDNRYEGLLIYPNIPDTLELEFSDTLRLLGQSIKLALVVDATGPLLNNDQNELPIVVLEETTFLSVAKRIPDTLLTVGVWKDRHKAASAVKAYTAYGLNSKISTNQAVLDEIALNYKAAALYLSVMGFFAIMLFRESFRNTELVEIGVLYFIIGLSSIEAAVMLELGDSQIKALLIAVFGVFGLVFALIGALKIRRNLAL